jgi:predicted Fe-Mo cluster-binding NifX family protein
MEVLIMRIAVPTFGTRVSPRIDCAAGFLVVDAAADSITSVRVTRAGENTLTRLLALFRLERVDVVVCCGIRRGDRLALEAAGIKVIPGKLGELKDVLVDVVGTLGRGGRRGESATESEVKAG